MAMPRLIARDSGWLTVLPEVVVPDELQAGTIFTVGHAATLQALLRHHHATPPSHRSDGAMAERHPC